MSGPKRRHGRGGHGGRHRPGSGRGGGGTGNRSNNPTTSPIQLPHVKVTIRNITGDQHETMEGLVDSIKEFLCGAFQIHSDNVSMDESSAYMMAWQKEKEDFEKSKALLESTANSTESTASLGWAYEDKIAATSVELPSPEAIVNTVERSALDGGNKQTIHSTVDMAMSQMINECGKLYLNYVGGRVTLDEESALVVALAEKIANVEKIKTEEKETEVVSAKQPIAQEVEKSVEQLTHSMEKLSTKTAPLEANVSRSTRARILSVTPVKKSKRRGIIGARVELVLYPPDPCLIFKERCREAGKIAGERSIGASKKAAELETKDGGKDVAVDNVESTKEKETITSQATQSASQLTAPTVPNFPRLSPAERSRAIARSRILMDRTISAMKIYARSNNYHGWEILESSSQKTWKGQSYDMVSALKSGASLSELLAVEEADGTKEKKVRGTGRGDRYDSTITLSEDYKSFLEAMENGGAVTPVAEKVSSSKPKEEKVDEEGRPLSAIVQHLQSKRQEEAKAKVEAAREASRLRAKASAESAREKARKKDLEAKTRKAKARMKREEERKKAKGVHGKVASRPGSVSSAVPPPGPVLLKKGSLSTSGFNSK